jgi:uncharacterized protein
MEMSPFHIDELTAQSLAHQSAGSAAIRPFMPDQHRAFFGLLPYLFVATTDAQGWPVASVLTGAPGFATSPDPTHLHIAAHLTADDPAAAGLAEGRPVGLLGLDLSTRRRNRANGTVESVDATGFSVAIEQSFGNCPQYIQTRRAEPHARETTPVEALAGLDDAARRLIAHADTFFVASRSRPTIGHGSGLDMSHRGGKPGFVAIAGDTLTIPDFRGNRYFNTLGNLLGDPRASLLFVDFASGELLQLQGTATIDWTDRAAQQIAGAQRSWSLKVERGWRRYGFPFDWRFDAYAPTTLATGTWRAAA